MDEVTIENFRCFQGRQTARLAPLTLLVGENSTGKTSFLAMTRILWHAVFRGVYRPDFREEPFDLGSFRDIANQSEGDGLYGREFSGGVAFDGTNVEATFRQGKISVEVCRLHIANSATSATWTCSGDDHVKLEVSNPRGRWQFDSDEFESQELDFETKPRSDLWGLLSLRRYLNEERLTDHDPAQLTSKEIIDLMELVLGPYESMGYRNGKDLQFKAPHALAPCGSSLEEATILVQAFSIPKAPVFPNTLPHWRIRTPSSGRASSPALKSTRNGPGCLTRSEFDTPAMKPEGTLSRFRSESALNATTGSGVILLMPDTASARYSPSSLNSADRLGHPCSCWSSLRCTCIPAPRQVSVRYCALRRQPSGKSWSRLTATI